jgi:enamine deaminase RidA (YjgF/YER057c/UK114 family)
VIEVVNPPELASFPGAAHAVRAGDLLFLSGQVALDNAGALVGAGDPVAQARQCFRNIEAVLRAAGGGLDSVVRLRCYLSDAATYPAYAGVKAELFPHRPPAGTAVIVGSLLDPLFLLEIEAVAVLSTKE